MHICSSTRMPQQQQHICNRLLHLEPLLLHMFRQTYYCVKAITLCLGQAYNLHTAIELLCKAMIFEGTAFPCIRTRATPTNRPPMSKHMASDARAQCCLSPCLLMHVLSHQLVNGFHPFPLLRLSSFWQLVARTHCRTRCSMPVGWQLYLRPPLHVWRAVFSHPPHSRSSQHLSLASI
jgi:hypothetical protein